MYRFVDCQGFAGGFTLGMVQAGFELAGKREMKGGFGAPNCEANRHLLGNSWKTEATQPENWSTVEADVVAGNPPCSGFSVLSPKDFRGADSKVNHCMHAFADYVGRVRPRIAVFESVQAARNRPDGLALMRQLRTTVEEATGEQYGLYHVRHNALAVGGAAMRKRYFWVVSTVPFGVMREERSPVPLHRDIFTDLENLAITYRPQPYKSPPTWWSKELRSDGGLVDGMAMAETPLKRRLMDLLAMTQWKPGENLSAVLRRCYQQHARFPDSWNHKADHILKRDFELGFTLPIRWDADKYCRVLTGGSLFVLLHPYLDRMITYREAARVMGFPDDWVISPLAGNPGMASTWGKGITVQCGRWIGGWIKNALDGNPGDYTGEPLGEREWDIDITQDYARRSC